MDCTQVNGMLDLLMDGALSDEQLKALEAHGQECPDCATALRSTLQMKALFEQMEPEADVPLEAQARWRGAVREAAKQRKQGRMRRWIASVAAAAVVLVGIGATFMLKGAPKQSAAIDYALESTAAPAQTEERPSESALTAGGVVSNSRMDAAPGAVVETDGMADEAMAMEDAAVGMVALEEESEADEAVSGSRVPACEVSLQVADVEVACNRICDLAQEYEAVADIQAAGDAGANVFVEIAAENAGDFLNAVAPMDGSERAVDVPELAGSGRVLVLLVLHG